MLLLYSSQDIGSCRIMSWKSRDVYSSTIFSHLSLIFPSISLSPSFPFPWFSSPFPFPLNYRRICSPVFRSFIRMLKHKPVQFPQERSNSQNIISMNSIFNEIYGGNNIQFSLGCWGPSPALISAFLKGQWIICHMVVPVCCIVFLYFLFLSKITIFSWHEARSSICRLVTGTEAPPKY